MQGRAAAPSRGAGHAHRLPQGTAAAAVPPGAAGVDPAAGHPAGGTPWSVLCNKTKTYRPLAVATQAISLATCQFFIVFLIIE